MCLYGIFNHFKRRYFMSEQTLADLVVANGKKLDTIAGALVAIDGKISAVQTAVQNFTQIVTSLHPSVDLGPVTDALAALKADTTALLAQDQQTPSPAPEQPATPPAPADVPPDTSSSN